MNEDKHSMPTDSIPSDPPEKITTPDDQAISSQVLKSAYNAFKKHWKVTRLRLRVSHWPRPLEFRLKIGNCRHRGPPKSFHVPCGKNSSSKVA